MRRSGAQHMKLPAEKLSGVLIGFLLLLIVAAVFVLRSQFATITGNEMNIDRAVFNAVNAGTLTGFELTVTVDSYKLAGQITVFVLIVAAALISLIVGGWAVVRICRMPFEYMHIVRSSVIAYVLAVLLGAAALLGPGISIWPALFQASSAFANAGHVIGAVPTDIDWRVHVILLPLAFIGGLGIPVILDLLSSPAARRRPHAHSVAVLLMSAIVYAAAVVLIFLLDWGATSAQRRQTLVLASSHVLNSRTLGWPLGSLIQLSRPSQWILMLVMIIGASPASTGGGMKTTTLYILGRDTARLLRGQVVGRIFGIAVTWVGVYLIIVVATTIGLVWNYPQEPGERMLFLAISAASNVGTSHAPLTLTGAGLYILSAAMLLGRLLPLGILWWSAKYAAGTDVAVG
jgi:trk system potassium uptake protein TrkH